jgi:hypothetical protein
LDSYGSVSFGVKPGASANIVDETVDEVLKANQSAYEFTLLNDYVTSIDGHPARAIEYRITPTAEGFPKTMFGRRYYYSVTGQLCWIWFTIAEDERHNDFEQGFDLLMASLKVVP